jgi:HK97 family phage prohead protease
MTRPTTRGDKEQRASYRGQREDRHFPVAMTAGRATRASASGNANIITVSGKPCVYNTGYTVFDAMGSFTEVVNTGAMTHALATSDTRFLYDHAGMTLARVSSGTLKLSDSKSALLCTAQLDQRMSVASDLAVALGRGDVREMSIGMAVADDVWNADYSYRVIKRFSALFDVSAVGQPASPTTSVDLVDAPERLLPVGLDGRSRAALRQIEDDKRRFADMHIEHIRMLHGIPKTRIDRLLQIDEDEMDLGRPPVR